MVSRQVVNTVEYCQEYTKFWGTSLLWRPGKGWSYSESLEAMGSLFTSAHGGQRRGVLVYNLSCTA